MRAWQMQSLGNPWDSEAMIQVDVPDPVNSEGGVLVHVEAVDLNFADILQCQGTYQVPRVAPFIPGLSAVGIVLDADEEAKSRGINPGDRVIGMTTGNDGGYAEQAVIKSSEAVRLEADVDPVQAAAAHVTYSTTWFAYHQRIHLQAGQTVLVLAAAGGVGSAAVQLAKAQGCWVVAAAGTGKQAACESLGADVALDYDTEDLYARVMELTDGRGVDVVYDPVGGRYFDIARRLVAWEGDILVIGFASGDIPSVPLNHVLVKNYSVVGVHMGGYWQHDTTPFARCHDEVYRMLKAGEIDPMIDRVLSFDELPQGLEDLANRKNRGRYVFDPRS